MNFTEKLTKSTQSNQSTLCVGLDPNLDLLPDQIKNDDAVPHQKIETFLKKVIDVTAEHCAAYKPNLGFFEALGPDGWDTFQAILDYIPNDKIVIADAKRGDISSTAEHYAKAFFNQFDVDSVTLNPLMGFETLDPFLRDASKGIYVLTLTSNSGARDIFQQQLSSRETVSTYIAKNLSTLQKQSDTSIGMVVGATKAGELGAIISQFPESPLLIPGVGKQGGSIDKLAKSLKNHTGIPLINSSRSIIYAGSDSKDWEMAVAKSAENLKNRLSSITERYV